MVDPKERTAVAQALSLKEESCRVDTPEFEFPLLVLL